ncbi:MAG TPA: methylenetetrahydrofolate reductase C-terminal domain-containing protein [Opitutaceae bacterium]|nr:methylenetetrahydrofolate reductase C-terminal domain-containing protein [Opitutaceae bacterium]
MFTLREKLEQSSEFLIGTELVSVRGGMGERSALKARSFANDLVESADVDWISITDNAGGNPQLAPTALGKPILYAGKEVVIHLTCKDLNRNALESEAWLLHSEGFNNILAMTGDYPVAGNGGSAKPVFDIDSVGLISMLRQMNEGLDPNDVFGRGRARSSRQSAATAEERSSAVQQSAALAAGYKRFEKTNFLTGAVTTNFKLREGEVMPQYQKLAAKIAAGARFIINQIGFDARKQHEQIAWMAAHGLGGTPLIGNVYLLGARVAALFNSGRIPGVVLTQPLLELCERHAASPDGGKEFFLEFAAKQIAIYRGLNYRGAYLGGVHNSPALRRILEIERGFAPDDWRQFAREISYSRPGEFFFYAPVEETGLIDPSRRALVPSAPSVHTSVGYGFSKWMHARAFTPGAWLNNLGARACARAADPMQGPRVLRALEHAGKSVMFGCRDCGDCSLAELAFLCPESQCAKNQRNGPCGGTHEGRCEVDGYGDCIWLRAYERLQHDGREGELLAHAPVIQDQSLRGTSSWANYWLGRDHTAKKPNPSTPAS